MQLVALSLSTVLVACHLTCGSAATAQTSDSTIRYQLPNGLRVILRPIPGAKQTAVVTLFSIGGDHDPEGASGLAHFVEHVYVTAATGDAPIRPAEELVRAYPAGWNAQTGDEFTVFATVVNASAADAEIRQHAERMADLKITDADLGRELPRIEQELANMFGRIPSIGAANLARERVRPAPRGGRKGGRIEQLSNVTVEQLQSRWDRYYKPRNARLVVAGRFDADHVRKVIETDFGSLPTGEPAPPALPPDRPNPAAAEMIEASPIRPGLPSTAALTFAAPAASSPDFPAFLVLFNRLQVQNAMVAANAASPDPTVRYAMLDDPNVLSVVANLKPDESLEQVAARLRAVIERAVAATWRAGEPLLTKKNTAFFLDTAPMPDAALVGNVYGVAFALGRREQLGLDGAALAVKLDGVTPADVKRIAEAYFSLQQGAIIGVRAKNP